MILVFILLGIIVLFSIINIILILSNIKVKIENLKIDNFKLDKKSKIYIQIYFLNKIKIFSIKKDFSKVKNMNLNKKIKKLKQIKKIKKINNIEGLKDFISALKLLKIDIEKVKLEVSIGLDNAYYTALLVGGISSLISIILPYFTHNSKEIKYLVLPKFNKNTINLELESIINIKIVHIIYIIYIMGKKGRIKNERTSNRRINRFCNEQY